jgi:hypothetical protein
VVEKNRSTRASQRTHRQIHLKCAAGDGSFTHAVPPPPSLLLLPVTPQSVIIGMHPAVWQEGQSITTGLNCMTRKRTHLPDPATLVARCNEIQTSLGLREVPEFEAIPELGMAVRLALHVRGLALIDYQVLKLVANHYLCIPTLAVERIIRLLADVEFVRIQSTGKTIKGVLPTVPYYEDLYVQLGDYATNQRTLNEVEQLALHLVERLAKSPEKVDALRAATGAENKAFDRNLDIGVEGSYLVKRRHRGRDILLNPAYFSENSELFADAVASGGAASVRGVLEAIRQAQGWPLSLIEKATKIGKIEIAPDQVQLLKRLAQDGAVKPPMVETTYAGQNYFMFTPTPSGAALSPTKREVYERAMAIVAAVRQGQLLPRQYAIRSPAAVIYTLRRDLKLGKATTEATQQYKNLTHLRVGRLVPTGAGFSELHIIDQPENREALDIAYNMVSGDQIKGMEVDEEARKALQQEQQYVESLVASSQMRSREAVKLSLEQTEQLDLLFMRCGA